ncbi:MAG: DNA-processing protein DprA [Coriobacteriia bacterium]
MSTRTLVRRSSAAYPSHLKELQDPPSRLYVIGDIGLLQRPGIAIIGSRKATAYGLAAAARFAAFAARSGVTVVSGGAFGCDSRGHQAALDAGGKTVAVLGCGADIDYPRSQRSLLERVRREGCVVSELPWGHPPARWAFPKRNRIIAGLSGLVLVVEAALPSGTFSTADHALAAGRDVLAVPGSVFSPTSEGTNRLIANGAIPICSEDDLAQALSLASLAPEGCAVSPPSTPADTSPGTDPHSTHLSKEAQKILSDLSAAPMKPAEIAERTGLDAQGVLIALGELDAAGLVERLANGSVSISQESLLRYHRG